MKQKIIDKIKNSIISIWIYLNPKSRVEYLYKRDFGRKIRWKAPEEMNEKIRWIQFYGDTSKWSKLADKYEVCKYLQGKGYSDILIKQFGSWNHAREIDFDKLPNRFVLKTNHGAGSVYIIPDKSKIKIAELCTKIESDLKKRYGVESYEIHYLQIKPKIIAEELLTQEESFTKSLIDYKFYVINGNPIICGVMFNREIGQDSYDVSYYDMNWVRHDEWLAPHKKSNNQNVPRPHNWERMLRLCRELCSDFPFVRLDLYESNGKLYFGEFTFTPAGLNGGSLNKDISLYIGRQIQL